MQPQHLKEDVLAHRIRHIRIDETHDRHAARQMGVGEDVVDPVLPADAVEQHLDRRLSEAPGENLAVVGQNLERDAIDLHG